MLAPAVLLLLATAPAPSGPAVQAQQPEAEVAPAHPGLVLGAAALLAPFVAGSLLLAADDRPSRQALGVYVMTAGFVVAPSVANGVEGNWRRAIAFGAASAATSAGAIVAMRAVDAFNPLTQNRRRVPFGVLLTAAFASAAGGVLATLVEVSPDEPPRAPGLALWLTPTEGGLVWRTAL
jgi:hypothetical protein